MLVFSVILVIYEGIIHRKTQKVTFLTDYAEVNIIHPKYPALEWTFTHKHTHINTVVKLIIF